MSDETRNTQSGEPLKIDGTTIGRDQLGRNAVKVEQGNSGWILTGSQNTINLNPITRKTDADQRGELLNRARSQFDAMPTDQVIEAHDTLLPAGSHLPFVRNRYFVGREEAFLSIAKTLKGGGGAVTIGQSATISGYGGIGKSSLAIEFAFRYGPYFPGGVFFLNFAIPDGIPAEIAHCGKVMGLPGFDRLDELRADQMKGYINQVIGVWKDQLPRLLILDNCEDPNLVARWVVDQNLHTCGVRVLVTSRIDPSIWREQSNVDTTALRLDALDRAESIELLRSFAKWMNEANADRVAEELGDFPLALRLAGGYLKKGKTPVDRYLKELSLTHRSMRGDWIKALSTNHVPSVAMTFELAYADLFDAQAELGGLPARILAHTALFAPGESLPEAILFRTFDDELDRFDLGLALDTAAQAGFLEITEEDGERTIAVHRLITQYLNHESERRGLAEAAQDAVYPAMLAYMGEQNEAGYPGVLQPFEGHADHLFQQIKP